MVDHSDKQLKGNLDEALWQVEEAKKRNLSILKPMNFINLSKEAQNYGNHRLAMGLLEKAKDKLFNDLIDFFVSDLKDDDPIGKIRMERTVKEARDRYARGDLKEAYEILFKNDKPKQSKEEEEVVADKDDSPLVYSEALDNLQKVWLKMKQEEGKGKDMSKAQKLVRDAKKALSKGEYEKVLKLSQEVMSAILSPQDRLREEVEDTIEDISRTLKALFPKEPSSPKERFFNKQIMELLNQSKESLKKGKHVQAINHSRKAREILLKLEQETIKSEIPKLIIELRTSIGELKANDVDVSYEEYLLKQVEETFWKGEYIKSRKTANKLESITRNAKIHMRMSQLSDRLGDLNRKLKDHAGKEGYLEAKEYIDKAKILMEQSAFDMASSFMDKAGNVLEA